ncbi:MAG TPA: ABC transporter ATP-binding protein [Polyangiaceae bacterium]|jgi:ABC-2 type transport system ATP-binding protein|nr:MAG: putative ABC transporter ATP-binding protein YbhF [Deltaproteobacteria bacterium ADurb.Bin207]HNS95644.1 ABC transporter ATP-binding protein [Polyangiaceae bacterium]HNZ25277.1 ABC transporter ATP-binding protein [Polyangiaceae bacterium]HOD23116.1 ABC transporter ATP-binding protein [Polyangiaceae bacterium]HOE50871.1 ABC transporter ATP-binding protein [Polyangiaceae bacterium]
MNIMEIRGLTRRFGNFVAVDAVDFDVRKGEIFGYLGANGAGKSTTIRMLCGLLTPSSGTALVAGIDVGKKPEQVKRVIGYMSQKFSLYHDLQVIENLEFFAGMYGLGGKRFRKRADELLSVMSLQSLRNVQTAQLPAGFRQRLALACSILHEPSILFLDEPTAGVDPHARRDFWRLVRSLSAQGTTILVTTHYMDEAEYCDRVGLMVDGRLAALGTPAALKAQFVHDPVVEVQSGYDALRASMQSLSGVRSVEPFGSAWHLRVERRESVAEVIEALVSMGIDRADVGVTEPTLEDVFLEVVGGAR